MPTNKDFRVYAGDSFGQALRHFREERGLTQAELANRIGLSRQYVNALESGSGTERLDRLVKAFKELGVRIKVGPEDW
jgi:transcriptional regulator with XRE-family HTH domain